jgi:tetratricopeptide (TPR) repeat protein
VGVPADCARAAALLREGLELQRLGELTGAVERYRASIATYPSAEAYTYLGWALGTQGRLDEAIAACERAIALDPEYGNPYNDIGVYLMYKGTPDDALPWFERAKHAARYEPRHYPYLNMGQIFAARGMLVRALSEFESALALAPDDPTAQHAVRAVSLRLN